MTLDRTVAFAKCISSIRSGISLAGEERLPNANEVGVLTLSAVAGHRFAPDQCKAVPVGMNTRFGPAVRAGTILMSRSNTLDKVGAAVLVDVDRTDRFLPDLLWEIALREDAPVTARFLVDYLATRDGRKLLRSAAMGTSGSMQKLSMTRLRTLEIPVLPRILQSRVARALDSYATVSGGMVDLAGALDRRRVLLAEQLLSGRLRSGTARSPDSSVRMDSWPTQRFREHVTESTVRNKLSWGPERVQGVFKGTGLAPMREHVRAADLRRYKVLPADGFAYNPMRLNIGSIARNMLDTDCLVSPDYVVFQTDPATLTPRYLDQLRRYSAWQRFVTPAGSGSVRVRIYFRDLAKMRIALPPIEEQHKIADTLELLDREIALLGQLRAAYAEQKRGLMQRLLSGDVSLPSDATPAASAYA